MKPMHYELYVDSLFLVNFVMNLYLLMLVNHSIQHIAAPLRLIGGAALGAVCFLLPFLVPAPAWLKLGAGILIGTAGMLRVSFPVRGFRMFLKLLERLAICSFGMGGGIGKDLYGALDGSIDFQEASSLLSVCYPITAFWIAQERGRRNTSEDAAPSSALMLERHPHLAIAGEIVTARQYTGRQSIIG